MKTLNFVSLNQIPLQIWRLLPHFGKLRAQQCGKTKIQFLFNVYRILVVSLTWRAMILTRVRAKYIFKSLL